jgi:hypothetical protein
MTILEPREKSGDSFFFAREDGELSVNDPSQTEFGFHDPVAEAKRPEPIEIKK